MPIFHLNAVTRWPHRPFIDRDRCAAMWARLRERFPVVFACVLMPNHFHVLVEAASEQAVRQALATLMSSFTQSHYASGERLWHPAFVALVPNDLHLKRTIRYIHLNPCRDRLVDDPLAWEWSTHRDAIGAAASPWLDFRVLHRIWGKLDFETRFHAYVSSDPDVKVGGTPLPKTYAKIAAPLPLIEWAVLQSTRSPADRKRRSTPQRRLMVLVAVRLGVGHHGYLAEWLGVSRRTVRYILGKKPVSSQEEAAIASALLLLSDRSRFAGPDAELELEASGQRPPAQARKWPESSLPKTRKRLPRTH